MEKTVSVTLILLKIFQKGADGSGLCAIELDVFLLKESSGKILNILHNLWGLELNISKTVSRSLGIGYNSQDPPWILGWMPPSLAHSLIGSWTKFIDFLGSLFQISWPWMASNRHVQREQGSHTGISPPSSLASSRGPTCYLLSHPERGRTERLNTHRRDAKPGFVAQSSVVCPVLTSGDGLRRLPQQEAPWTSLKPKNSDV